jgi:hypothetical protein
MKYLIAAFVAALMILAGFALAGAGHGWVPGSLGSFALAVVSFFVWSNALSPLPSRRIAITALAVGVLVCVAVAFATVTDGVDYLLRFLRVNGLLGAVTVIFAYLNWVLVSALALYRAHRSPSLGT